MHYPFLFFLALLAFFPSTISQSLSLSYQQRENLDAIAVRDVPPAAPGIATGIVSEGSIVYRRTAGFADLTDSTLIQPNTRFNIASNGKQFTALAVLWLEQQEKLSLTDDIRTYFPKLFPQIESPITIQHLLHHSSGIRDVYDLWSLKGLTWWKLPYSNRDVMSLLEKQAELNFRPGTDYGYSNSNYILLAEIVAKVSGKSFVDFTTGMFQRLGMPHTSFVDDHRAIEGPVAKPYFNFDTWFTFDWIWDATGDGNVFSSLDDQLRWEQILQDPSLVDFPADVLEKSRNRGPLASAIDYGYGSEFETFQGHQVITHAGATGPWKAYFLRFPEKNLALLTLTNSGKTDPRGQTRQMARVLLGLDESNASFETEPLLAGAFVSIDRITGIYLDDDQTVFRFEQREDGLYLIRPGRNDMRMERESGNLFHQWNDPAFKLAFTPAPKGDVSVTAYYPTHAPYTLWKRGFDPSQVDHTALNGQYVNAETGVEIKVEYLEAERYRLSVHEREVDGYLAGPRQLIAGAYQVSWKGSEAMVSEIFLNAGRIRQVRFERVDQRAR